MHKVIYIMHYVRYKENYTCDDCFRPESLGGTRIDAEVGLTEKVVVDGSSALLGSLHVAMVIWLRLNFCILCLYTPVPHPKHQSIQRYNLHSIYFSYRSWDEPLLTSQYLRRQR